MCSVGLADDGDTTRGLRLNGTRVQVYTMKITVMEEGLDIFVPDEELPELYRLIYKSSHLCDMEEKLLGEIYRLITPQQIQEAES